jgi:antirestriction protein ArdC
MQTMRAENRRKQPARDHYQDVTDRIIAALEAGVVPWRKAWQATRCGGPFNPTTRRVYRGINRILLDLCQVLHKEGDPRWCSYRQALVRGWQVRRGESGTRIYFFKALEIDEAGASGDRPGEDRDDKRVIHLLRAYTVFHASQIDGIPSYVAPDADASPWRRPEAVQTILENSGADIRTGGNRAFYDPARDFIVLPPAHAFAQADGWAATAMHEAAHYAEVRIMPSECKKGLSHVG